VRSKNPPVISYFFVGVGKCGTSWIYEFLKNHQAVSVPSLKEPHIVDQPEGRIPTLIADLYQSDDKMADFSNTYYWDPANPKKIVAHNPDAKIIFTVRQPSARIISHFRFLIRSGIVQGMTLEQYLDQGDPEHIVERSEYWTSVARYTAEFGADRVLVLPLELLSSDPQAYADTLLDFLGVDRITLEVGDKTPVLQSARPRSPMAAKLARSAGAALRRSGQLRLLGRLKSSDRLRRMLFKPGAPDADVSFGKYASQMADMDQRYGQLIEAYQGA
jgi:hypothetical protein